MILIISKQTALRPLAQNQSSRSEYPLRWIHDQWTWLQPAKRRCLPQQAPPFQPLIRFNRHRVCPSIDDRKRLISTAKRTPTYSTTTTTPSTTFKANRFHWTFDERFPFKLRTTPYVHSLRLDTLSIPSSNLLFIELILFQTDFHFTR